MLAMPTSSDRTAEDMEWEVHYKGTEPQEIRSTIMALSVSIEGNTAVFDDPMMVMFSEESIDQFAENVKALPFIEEVNQEYHDAYEELETY